MHKKDNAIVAILRERSSLFQYKYNGAIAAILDA
jgi:hypothetical protein